MVRDHGAARLKRFRSNEAACHGGGGPRVARPRSHHSEGIPRRPSGGRPRAGRGRQRLRVHRDPGAGRPGRHRGADSGGQREGDHPRPGRIARLAPRTAVHRVPARHTSAVDQGAPRPALPDGRHLRDRGRRDRLRTPRAHPADDSPVVRPGTAHRRRPLPDLDPVDAQVGPAEGTQFPEPADRGLRTARPRRPTAHRTAPRVGLPNGGIRRRRGRLRPPIDPPGAGPQVHRNAAAHSG
jgi:hypothetical protein